MSDAEDKDQVQHSGAKDDEEHDRQQDEGEGELNVAKAHDDIVDPAAEVARDKARRDADGAADRDGSDADEERDARAVKEAGEDVAAERVGAHEEGRAVRAIGQGGRKAHDDVLPVGVHRREPRAEGGDDHGGQQDQERKERPFGGDHAAQRAADLTAGMAAFAGGEGEVGGGHGRPLQSFTRGSMRA